MGEDADRVPAEPPDLRVGHDERAAALRALDTHFEAGRLDVTEYGDRSGTAGAATHRHELEELFTDLPAPHPEFAAPHSASAAVSERAPEHHPLRHRHTAMALLPLLAVIGIVLLVVVGGQPAGLAFFPIVFLLAGRFGPRRF